MKKKLEIDSESIQNIGIFKDSQIKILKSCFDVRVHSRRGKMIIQGDQPQVDLCFKTIESILDGVDRGRQFTEENIRKACDLHLNSFKSEQNKGAAITTPGSIVSETSKGQDKYLAAMHKNTITFACGPAGTGKTFLAVGMAVQCLLAGQVDRIILVRPAVEAGEKLGFLPGDLNEKIRPYLLPIFDSLRHFLGDRRVENFAEKNIIEVAPLAYMRGRTLENCYMILDEAQNTTRHQMKMFLTRLGSNSKAVITGDLSQVDLPKGEYSGMRHAMDLLGKLKDICVVRLSASDIKRHPVVGAIVRAYDKESQELQAEASEDKKSK